MNFTTSNRRRRKNDVVGELQEGKGDGSAEGMYGDEVQQQLYNNANNSGSSLLPPSLDSDAIADTIKSFFPMGGGNAGPTTTSSASDFQDYPQGGLLQRGGGGDGRQSQDLKLSLQSFQDPTLMQSQSHHHGTNAVHDEQQHSLFPGAVLIGFENPNPGWGDSQHQPNPDLGRLHRLVVGWNTQHTGTETHSVGGSGGSSGGGGYVFNQPSPLLQHCLVVANTISFLHRGDPFSPVTHPQSERGLVTLALQLLAQMNIIIIKLLQSTHKAY
ncbi:unnamed protein product [Amaranthus hypochondriacus]